MAQYSTIEWTEATWNPVVGCRKVSSGCANCYAERLAAMAEADVASGRNPGKKAAYLQSSFVFPFSPRTSVHFVAAKCLADARVLCRVGQRWTIGHALGLDYLPNFLDA
jgi:hypothetical protein